jgi:cation transport regulator ChaC
VPPPQTAEVLARLDVRERGGYERYCVEGQLPHAREAVEMLLYRAGPANPHYLGPAPLGAIADQVRSARGPSGPNVEYVTELAHALRAMDANDSHVFDIEALL